MTRPYLPNDFKNLLKVYDPEEELIDALETLVTQFPPKESYTEAECTRGLYNGPTSYGYLFMNLAQSHPRLNIRSRIPTEWAAAYLAGVQPSVPVTYHNIGIESSELAYCAVQAAHKQDLSFVRHLLAQIEDVAFDPRAWDEWSYGRAGTLYLLRLVRTWFPDSSPYINPVIRRLCDLIISRGPDWVYQKKHMTGLGHGDLGIVVQILLSDSSYAPQLEDKITELLDLQLPNGNWPQNKESSRELMQWCHGAPGMILGFLDIADFVNPELQRRVNEAVSRARELVWREGLLTNWPNLCHGISGNAFALPVGERRVHFMAFAGKEMLKLGEEQEWWVESDYGLSLSLGLGLAGRAWGWAAIERRKKCYITFDDV